MKQPKTPRTYKEKYIAALTKEIINLDKLSHAWIHPTERHAAKLKAIRLREIRTKALQLPGSAFVPKKTPPAEFLSIKLSVESLVSI